MLNGWHLDSDRVEEDFCRILSARVSEVARQPIRSLARKDGGSFFPSSCVTTLKPESEQTFWSVA